MFESTGLLIGWIVCTYIVVQIVLGINDGLKSAHFELADKLRRRLDDIVHRVKIEQQDEVEYWYDMDDNEFLAQGRTKQEIVNTLKSRFPDHIFYLENSREILCAKHNWESHPVANKVDVK